MEDREHLPITTNIRALESFLNRRLVRLLLGAFLKTCPKDRSSFLETALELIAGCRDHACFLCSHVVRPLVAWVLSTSYRRLEVETDQALDTLSDPHWRRGILSVLRGIAKFGVRRPFTPGAPILVVWNYTWACNLRCKHCYASASPSPRPNELNPREAMKTVEKLADSGVTALAFSGGEPLMRGDIYDVLKLAKEHGMFTAIATNGTLITKEVAWKLKKLGVDYVEISLDGAKPSTHDEFRGIPGAFKKAVRGIRNCVEAGLWTQVAMTIVKQNVDELPAMIDLCEELGVKGLTCFNFVPTGRGVFISENDLTPEERERVLKYMAREALRRKIQITSTAPQYARAFFDLTSKAREITIPTHFYNPHFPKEVAEVADFIGGCGAGRFYCALDPDGSVLPCVFMPIKVANIRTCDFQELWENCPVFLDLRDRDKLKPHCGECEYRYICGGCRARAYGYFGDYLAPDPGCVNNLSAWESLSREVQRIHA